MPCRLCGIALTYYPIIKHCPFCGIEINPRCPITIREGKLSENADRICAALLESAKTVPQQPLTGSQGSPKLCPKCNKGEAYYIQACTNEKCVRYDWG